MKVISGLLLFILAGVAGVYAQQQSGKVIAEIAASNERTIKNAPFSAETVSESVQVLADGNRIVRNSTAKLYRDSAGRFRTEMSGGSAGVLGTTFSLGHGTTILDPVIGHRVMLDTLNGTARIASLGGGQNLTIVRGGVGGGQLSEAQRAEMERKLSTAKTLTEAQRAEYAAKAKEYEEKAVELRAVAPAVSLSGSGGFTTTFNGEGGFAFATASNKYETKTEELGTRDIEGVVAEGTRRVTTIPEGAIGNERPIEIVYERWYSKDLGLVVLSKHSDPRFGEQTYRVTNIVRAEPDPSLFSVPHRSKLLAEPATVYRLNTKPAPVMATSPARSTARPARVVNAKATNP
jgi:hypothetical protein